MQRIRNVGKVELIGLQDEKIWIDLSNTKLATLGLPLAAVQKALEEQNAVASSGFFETASDRVQLRVSGRFDSVEEIRDFPIPRRRPHLPHRRCGRGSPRLQRSAGAAHALHGRDAIGLAVAMKPGGDILVLGKALKPSSPACSSRCRPDWNCARCPTSRRRYVPGSASSSGCWPRRW